MLVLVPFSVGDFLWIGDATLSRCGFPLATLLLCGAAGGRFALATPSRAADL